MKEFQYKIFREMERRIALELAAYGAFSEIEIGH